MQLDIFENSRDVMLRNDVINALEQRDASAARDAWNRFAQAYPSDESLAALQALVDALGGSRHRFDTHKALGRAREAVDQLRAPAQRVFGLNGGLSWLTPLWEEMALRAAVLAFRADRAQDHAAALWLRARSVHASGPARR